MEISGSFDMPKVIKIASANYSVREEIDILDAVEAEGRSSGNELDIMVRANRKRDSTCDTLLHEILHQCLFQAGFQSHLRVGAGGLEGSEAEEAIVRAMTGLLLGVLRNNPKLLYFLTS